MLEGRLAQLDTPEVVFGRPAGHVARFVGVENLVPAAARASDGLAVDTGTLCVLVPGELAVGRPVMLCIRPEEVVLQPGPTRSAPDSALNHFPGRVAELVPVGMQVRVLVECGRPLIALVTRRSVHDLSLQVGSEVTLSFKASAVHLIEREDVGASR
jgi:molybdopterin-binding protein